MDPSDIDESIDERFDNLESLILEKGAKIESLEKLITAIEGQIDDEEYYRIQFKKHIEKIFRTLKQVASKAEIKMDYDLRYEFAPGPKDPRGEETRGAASPRSRGTPRGRRNRSRRNRGRLKKRRTTRVANRKRSKNKRGKK